MSIHRGEIQKALVNGIRHQCRRVLFQNQKHLARQLAVGVIMRAAQNPGRAKPFRLETGRAGFDTVFFRLPIGGNHNAVASSSPTDPHRTPF
jgi:hypothetical protein